jgi:three-Cys-motif partner protein
VGHSFGGPWTEDKLRRIDEYLDAYMTIFTANPRAAALRTTYLDAFAGTGFRTSPVSEDRAEGSLFEDALEDPEANALKKGSAYVALRTQPPFGRYIFVDRNPVHAKSLGALRQEFPELAKRIFVRPTPTHSCRRGAKRPTGIGTELSCSWTLTGCRSIGRPSRQ